MMIVMKEGATAEEVEAVVDRVRSVGAKAHVSEGELVTVIGAIGDREHVDNLGLEGFPGVDHLVPILKPYKLASAQYKRGRRTVVEVDGRRIGGSYFATIAGPCRCRGRRRHRRDPSRARAGDLRRPAGDQGRRLSRLRAPARGGCGAGRQRVRRSLSVPCA